jgi:hypothetical protein
MTDLGPPSSGGFAIGTLWMLFVMGLSFYEIYVQNVWQPFLINLAMSTLFLMFVFVAFGKVFQRKHLIGQIAFIALGLMFAVFSDQILGAFNVHLSLLPLSWSGPLIVEWNGADVTGQFEVFLAGAFLVIAVWRRSDLKVAVEEFRASLGI